MWPRPRSSELASRPAEPGPTVDAGEGHMDPELMRRLEKIDQRMIRAEERDEAHRGRMLELLEQIRDKFTVAEAAPMNQSQLIRWLAAAVVLASLGSKVLELLPALVGKG